MSRYRNLERFEVKNEMGDVKEINPDDNKQTGGKSSIQSQEETKEEADKIGFDDEIDFLDTNDLIEDYKTANEQVESELEQYYDDEITKEELKAYLVSKLTEIYGEKLNQCNLLIDDFVEEFLDYYEFNGAESYRQLARTAEETITNITSAMGKSKDADDQQNKSRK